MNILIKVYFSWKHKNVKHAFIYFLVVNFKNSFEKVGMTNKEGIIAVQSMGAGGIKHLDKYNIVFLYVLLLCYKEKLTSEVCFLLFLAKNSLPADGMKKLQIHTIVISDFIFE